MSSYEDRFVKIRVVFHALYFENEIGEPMFFFVFCFLFFFISDKVTHYVTVAKV